MMQPHIHINNISFYLPNGNVIFNDLALVFSQRKIGLIGKNGVGKSTLLKLILGELSPASGCIQVEGNLNFVPQNPILHQQTTVAGFLECEEKINALHRITGGSVDEKDFILLNNEWDIEKRVKKSLNTFGLSYIPYHRSVTLLSGGEITRLFLAKAFLSDASFLLLDEPTNHLDNTAREKLYNAIAEWKGGVIVASHDRSLLNKMDEIVELTTRGANVYGGNYDDYIAQKNIEKSAREKKWNDARKEMQKSKDTIQMSREKHEQNKSYGRELRRSGSIDKMAANSKKGRSERTQAKMAIKEERLLEHAGSILESAREMLEISEEIHIDLPGTKVPDGKIMLDIENLCFCYPDEKNIIHNFSLKIQGPQKIAFTGENGSGKTTLINLILGKWQPQSGKIYIGTEYVHYLDQNASLLNKDLSILNNFLRLNPDANENTAYRNLASFLFKNVSANRLVRDLSGGEKLRALLACILMSNHPPQLLILDEPTNHLDIDSIKSIESALKNFQGTLIVISHDKTFLQNIGVKRLIEAPFTQDK